MRKEKIITDYVFPPIPDRRFDWCAYYENDVENQNLYGWGKTKEEALEDLKKVMGSL